MSNKIYILLSCDDQGENDRVEGVYSSREKAESVYQILREHDEHYYYIEECDIDDVPRIAKEERLESEYLWEIHFAIES